jgi:hypothetical protein
MGIVMRDLAAAEKFSFCLEDRVLDLEAREKSRMVYGICLLILMPLVYVVAGVLFYHLVAADLGG